jgi:hypothetical protein
MVGRGEVEGKCPAKSLTKASIKHEQFHACPYDHACGDEAYHYFEKRAHNRKAGWRVRRAREYCRAQYIEDNSANTSAVIDWSCPGD